MVASSYPLPSFTTLYSVPETDGTVTAGKEQSGQRSLIRPLVVMSFSRTPPSPCMNSSANPWSPGSLSGSDLAAACISECPREHECVSTDLLSLSPGPRTGNGRYPLLFLFSANDFLHIGLPHGRGPPSDVWDAVEFSKTTPSEFPSILKKKKVPQDRDLVYFWSFKKKMTSLMGSDFSFFSYKKFFFRSFPPDFHLGIKKFIEITAHFGQRLPGRSSHT